MKKIKSKNILVIGLGNLGLNYLKAIFILPYNVNLYIHDKNLDRLNQKFIVPSKIKIYKITSLEKFNKSLDLVIISSTANKRLDLIKKLKKNKIKYWILEKLLEQSVTATNSIYRILKSDNCWVNIPRRTMPEYSYIKSNLIFDANFPVDLKLSMNGFRIVTNSIHFIDLLCWLVDSKVSAVDINKLKNEWIESKRLGFYETGGTLTIILNNKSKIILKAGKKTKKSDIIIGNKKMHWKINESKLYAVRSDGLKIKIKLPLVSEIMKKVIKDIFKKKTCSLPVLKEVVENHNVLIKSLQKHWLNCKKQKVQNLPVT